jgi:hypothetical protein
MSTLDLVIKTTPGSNSALRTPRSSLNPWVTKIFALMDVDGDGHVEEAEGVAIGRILSGGDGQKAREWWTSMLSIADADCSKTLTLDEWRAYVGKAYDGKDVARAEMELARLYERLELGLARRRQQQALQRQQQATQAVREKMDAIRTSLLNDLQALRESNGSVFHELEGGDGGTYLARSKAALISAHRSRKFSMRSLPSFSSASQVPLSPAPPSSLVGERISIQDALRIQGIEDAEEFKCARALRRQPPSTHRPTPRHLPLAREQRRRRACATACVVNFFCREAARRVLRENGHEKLEEKLDDFTQTIAGTANAARDHTLDGALSVERTLTACPSLHFT